jgi:U3 small nucleolar RNA-associated protein 25
MDDGNSTTTRLLTLLNVSAVKTGKRKRDFNDSVPVQKLNKRKSVLFTDVSNDEQIANARNVTQGAEGNVELEVQVAQEDLTEDPDSQGAPDVFSWPVQYC